MNVRFPLRQVNIYMNKISFACKCHLNSGQMWWKCISTIRFGGWSSIFLLLKRCCVFCFSSHAEFVCRKYHLYNGTLCAHVLYFFSLTRGFRSHYETLIFYLLSFTTFSEPSYTLVFHMSSQWNLQHLFPLFAAASQQAHAVKVPTT